MAACMGRNRSALVLASLGRRGFRVPVAASCFFFTLIPRPLKWRRVSIPSRWWGLQGLIIVILFRILFLCDL
jgi:hypothetical protein